MDSHILEPKNGLNVVENVADQFPFCLGQFPLKIKKPWTR